MPDQASVMPTSTNPRFPLPKPYVGANYTNADGGNWLYYFSNRYKSNPDAQGVCAQPDGMGKPLAKYLKTDKVWRCPSAYIPDPYFTANGTVVPLNVQVNYVSSYDYKLALEQTASYYMHPLSISSVVYPTHVTVLYEMAWHGNYNSPLTYMTTIDDGPTKRFNVIFFDCHVGHVDTRRDWAIYNHYDMNWYYGNLAKGNWDVTQGARDP